MWSCRQRRSFSGNFERVAVHGTAPKKKKKNQKRKKAKQKQKQTEKNNKKKEKTMKFFKALLTSAYLIQSVFAECEHEEAVPYIRVIITAPGENDPNFAAVKNAFEDAASRWSEIIKTDLPDITLRNNVDLSNRCGQQGAVLQAGETVDNVIIFAEVRNIDGPGGILGQAGACVFNRVNNVLFPRVGSMTFDINDLGRNFDAVVLHEMGHVLGIGNNQWRQNLRGSRQDPRYVGQGGFQGFQDSGGSGQLDVENVGGGGTALAHWRTSSLSDELMTGFLNNQEQKISKITVGSLADLGYDVDDSKADSFVVPGARRLEGISQEEHDHQHARNLEDADASEWEVNTWPDISKEAAFLGPDGTFIASTEDLSESNTGLIIGSGLGGAFVALTVAGAIVTIRNRRMSNGGAQVTTSKAMSANARFPSSGSSGYSSASSKSSRSPQMKSNRSPSRNNGQGQGRLYV